MLLLFIVFLSCLLVFSVIHYLCKIKKPLKRAFLSVTSGPLVLIILNFITSITGVYIPLSQMSFIVSMVLGVPGVATLTLMQILM
ncbi:MAG: pro-sigmaK processing inhibitor BofA family protein [Ruminococcus sp.]|nr:pro-sigmaK processing inhibitor BofA family protein [Ruminococcus sp.]